MSKCKKMTPKDAGRIQGTTAKKNDGKVQKGSFAARAQSSGAKNQNSKQSSSPKGNGKTKGN